MFQELQSFVSEKDILLWARIISFMAKKAKQMGRYMKQTYLLKGFLSWKLPFDQKLINIF